MKRIVLSLLVFGVVFVVACALPSTSVPAPAPSAGSIYSPPIMIALDYFGIRNTHWTEQVGGEPLAKIQLIVVVSDEQQNLTRLAIPPEGIPGFDMNFFQVKAIKDYRPPVVFKGLAVNSVTVYIAAYNVNKGPITKSQIDMLAKFLGFPGLEALKVAVPDRKLIGYYWHTWGPSENWGIGRYDEQGEGDLKVWLRIGSNQMPEPAQFPKLKPNVKIEGKLPANVRVRTDLDYRSSDFAFTLTNNESFAFPVYWHIETDSNPGTTINFVVYPTEGKINLPARGEVTHRAKYWFKTPGDYKWKYVVESPKGNLVALWESRLKISP